MTIQARRIVVVTVLATGLVAGACSVPGASSPGPSKSAPSISTAAPSPPFSPSAPVNEAPLATLVVGTDRRAGEVGGFTFGRYAQDAPWLPATSLEVVNVPAGTQLQVELDDRASVAGWVARVATAADATADTVTGLAEGDGPTAIFAAPRAGDWVLSVTITYDDGLGSGAYYWHVVVN